MEKKINQQVCLTLMRHLIHTLTPKSLWSPKKRTEKNVKDIGFYRLYKIIWTHDFFVHLNSQPCLSMGKTTRLYNLKTKKKKKTNQHTGRCGYKAPPLVEAILTLDSCLGKESYFLSRMRPLAV